MRVAKAFPFALPPDAGGDFPTFTCSDADVASLCNDMFRRHFFAIPGPSAYIGDNQSDWREWNALCTAWLDTNRHRVAGRNYNDDLGHFLEHIELDDQGYVYTYPASFPERNRIGWPFPDWRQSRGTLTAWSFAGGSTGGWRLVAGREPGGSAGERGFVIGEDAGRAEVQSPDLGIAALLAPYLALDFVCPSPVGGQCIIETTAGPFVLPWSVPAGGPATAFLPLYRVLPSAASITGLRLRWDLPAGGEVEIRRIEPLFDTRHNTNNSHFVLAMARHVLWGTDLAFLVRNVGRMRAALRHLDTVHLGAVHGLIQTPWWGHDGLVGLGHGIGSNYWDLLPFGHRDLYATAYYLGALEVAAEVEDLIAGHPEWGVSPPPVGQTVGDLRASSERVRQVASAAFWNAETGRFVGTIDAQGHAWDFGFVFANLEALHYGIGSRAQAASVYDWLDGQRVVAGDTSQGADIYRWRFAPRATTRRNERWYTWVWNGASVPWGDQVQDGGAVLYTSYHDIMNRLRYRGSDDAFARLRAIVDWYREVQEAGGYRPYYQTHPGSLQGAGTAGGLGVDAEFVESALVPLVLLYGFLGVRATGRGLEVRPNLPARVEWMGVSHLRYGDRRYHLLARRGVVTVEDAGSGRTWTAAPDGLAVAAAWL